MNKILLTTLLFLTLGVNQTCESDDLNESESYENTLNGSWNLISIQGGSANVDYQFDKGLITWEFHLNTNTLEVVNNISGNSGHTALDTGEYSFSIIQFDAISLLEINDESYGSYFMENNSLIIDQNGSTSGNSDGYTLGFLR
ncbi:hypothetical protein [Winogradskyella flava]|uniref:Lipocalin-like domain-containing protein n=1 Tax=Winogradskyella flava TaxID=1884876 RepID=A0A842IUI7_9FLAO|nr:hypothetical protein [Winogradskyella flava]MBC2845416.1 hypothetical protein [Winogradskyella flava]